MFYLKILQLNEFLVYWFVLNIKLYKIFKQFVLLIYLCQKIKRFLSRNLFIAKNYSAGF